MLEKITAWLANPKRKYKEGLEIFRALASDVQKKNFAQYFEKDSEKVTKQFDVKFTMLVNQVAFIQNRVKSNPEAFKKAVAHEESHKEGGLVSAETETSESTKVNPDKLPEELQPVLDRIKEIVPLMARLHADMDNEPADDKRLPIIQELVKLDDERRAAWAKIDNYEPSELETQVEEKTIAMGADIQKRIGQLKENIARNLEGVKKHTANKKMNHAAKAKKRVEEYTDELTQLELIVGK